MAMPQASVAFRAGLEVVRAVEPRIAEAITDELDSQRHQLKLIASENYASPAVLLAMGNWLSDKYAEGTPGHRFYAGCEVVDRIETIANDHAAALFCADHAYVQPHSGIDANLVGFWSILARRVELPRLDALGVTHVNDLAPTAWEDLRLELAGQRMIGMALDAGGHLTHGFRPNISGKLFEQRSYGVDPDTGLLDYDQVRTLARQFRPLVIVAGYSAYPRNPNFRLLREIADEVDATLLVDMAHFAGLVAGKVFTGDFDPVPHAHIVTTTTHKTLRGPRGGMVLTNDPELAGYVDRGCPLVLDGLGQLFRQHLRRMDLAQGDAGLFERLAACHLLDRAFPFLHMAPWKVNAALKQGRDDQPIIGERHDAHACHLVEGGTEGSPKRHDVAHLPPDDDRTPSILRCLLHPYHQPRSRTTLVMAE